jgi:type I restriction enzyme S subunit
LAGFEYTEHIKLQEFGEIPVVRAQNVRPLEIDKTNLLYIDREVSQLLDRCSLTKKCLLVTFIGAGIGDVATFNESNRWHLAPNVAKMEPFEGCEEMIDVSYVNYFLMSKIGQRELFKHIKATAQPSLSMGTIRDIDVPLPPLSEQKRIVAEIEKQFAKTKQLKEHIIANQQATEQLLKALLHQAFEVWETETIE